MALLVTRGNLSGLVLRPCRVVFIPDYLPSDSTLAQSRVAAKQIGLLDSPMSGALARSGSLVNSRRFIGSGGRASHLVGEVPGAHFAGLEPDQHQVGRPGRGGVCLSRVLPR